MTTAVPPLSVVEPVPAFSCGRLLREGLRLTNANPIAPLFLFLAVAPMFALSSAGEMMSMRSASLGPAGLPNAADAFTGWLMQFWQWAVLPFLFLTVLVVLPWIFAGAAGRFAEKTGDFERRRRPFAEHANRFWGRMVSMTFAYALLATAFNLAESMLIEALVPAETGNIPGDYDSQIAAQARWGHQPILLAVAAVSRVSGAGLMTVALLCLAALATEDGTATGSIRRGVSFVREHAGTTLRLWLVLFAAMTFPAFLIGEADLVARYARAPLAFLLLRFASTACSSYFMMVGLAATICAYDRYRPTATSHGSPADEAVQAVLR